MTATDTLVRETGEPAAPVTTRTGMQRLVTSLSLRNFGIVYGFVALIIFLSIASPVFFSAQNIGNLLFQSTAIGLIAVAGTLLLISGGFDLSVGATFALAGVVAAQCAATLPIPLALGAGVLVGAFVGLLNGLVTTFGRINPLVATLASSIVIGGVAFALTGGYLVSVADPAFQALGRGEVGGIRFQTIIWLSFALICGLVLAFTTFGRHIYASGGNPDAARLSGIKVGLVRTVTYTLSGFAAGLAGVLAASQVSTGQADTGATLALSAIAAIVVGGTSIWGGEGAVWRTVLGVLLLALIGNGFNLLQVPPTYQDILKGLIILGAVAVDAWTRRRT
ncbi:ABC transporter permease [Microbacterium sp.]|uniref:ABC transporter permease n=1 Tax=Microbacterium sp. TaxID=51671 RepID=UPI0037CB7A85